jgi:hypothetical protein
LLAALLPDYLRTLTRSSLVSGTFDVIMAWEGGVDLIANVYLGNLVASLVTDPPSMTRSMSNAASSCIIP